MLVSELKKVIKDYNLEEKDKLILEFYKRIPKRVKEEYEIDDFILNIKNNVKDKTSKKEEKLTFNKLKKQIVYFLDCVDNDLYASPNRIVSKDERSKWRFKVKKFYKELNSYEPVSIEGIEATYFLEKLYYFLSLGSCILKFSNWETFKAIGVSQAEFLSNIMQRKLISSDNLKENISFCTKLLEYEFDPYRWESIEKTFVSNLKTIEERLTAIDNLKEKVDVYNNKLKEAKNNYHLEYTIEEKINTFVECIVYIYFDLNEVDNGIKYFHKYYKKRDNEIKEYILLNYLEYYELDEEWIEEYEKHLNLDYRKSLKEHYKLLKDKISLK